MRTRSFISQSGSIVVISYDAASNETRAVLDGNGIYTGGGDRVDDLAQKYIDQGWTEL